MAEQPALRSEGQGLKEDVAGRKISSYIVWQAISSMHFSHRCVCLRVSLCAVSTSIYCLCVTVYVRQCVFPAGVAASRILAQGFLSIGTWQREQMGFSEVCLQLIVPCFSTAPKHHQRHHISIPPATPSTTASCAWPEQFHQSTWSFFYGNAQHRFPWESVSWNAQPLFCCRNTLPNNKNWADHLSNMQYWWVASHAMPIATAAVIVLN